MLNLTRAVTQRTKQKTTHFLTTNILTTQQRFWHELNSPRVWVQKYDKALAEKYPRILEVIEGKLSRAKLNTTERTALYVATYKTGLPGGKRIRQREKRINFTRQVDSLVRSWQQIEFTQKKATDRNAILNRGKATKLSTWKDGVNHGRNHGFEFKITTNEPGKPTVPQLPPPTLNV